jgi:hypothetical protein
MATGGDMVEVTFNHPTKGTGVFFVKSAEDHESDLGGYRSEDDDNLVDGGGEMIDIMKRVRWKQSFVASWDANSREDLELAVSLAGDAALSDWTFSFINGTVYKGKGKPVGDLKGAGSSATFPLMIAGGGELKKISG